MRCPAHLVPTARAISAASRSSISVVGGAAAQDRAQVELVEREQAGAELALGGDPDPVALLAERLGDAGDHPDVADAVGVAEALGRLDVLAVVGPRHRQALEREDRVDAFEDLAARGRPRPGVQAPSASSGMNSMKRTPTPRSRPKAARSTTSSSLTPRITTQLTFTGSSPASTRGVDPGDDPVEIVAPGELPEDLGAQRVERHVDAPQAGRGEVVRHLRQPDAVGGHRDVDAERGQHAR